MDGFIYDGETIDLFECRCMGCESLNTTIEYEFNYYGGMTGYDMNLKVKCRNCDNVAELPI